LDSNVASNSDSGGGGAVQPANPGSATQQGDTGQQGSGEPPVPTVQNPPADPETSGGGEEQPRESELAAIVTELNRISAAIENEAATESDRRRVEGVYDDATMPDSLRARAALLVGHWHVFLGTADDSFDQSCQWYRRASAVDPGNPNVQTALNQPQCRDQ
jgi:hypothetical protein